MKNNQTTTIIESIKGGSVQLTKTNVEQFTNQILFEFNTGNKNPFDYLSELEFIHQAIENAKSQIRESLIDELEKNPEAKQGIKRNGVQFKLKESGVRYDFSNNEKWQVLKSECDDMQTALKQIESELKTLKSSRTMVDESTGEVFQIHPPIKSSKTTIEITLPK